VFATVGLCLIENSVYFPMKIEYFPSRNRDEICLYFSWNTYFIISINSLEIFIHNIDSIVVKSRNSRIKSCLNLKCLYSSSIRSHDHLGMCPTHQYFACYSWIVNLHCLNTTLKQMTCIMETLAIRKEAL
jgi:hypothetical protein